ncbi:MAG: hypothetical protein WEA99_13530 [Brumimicrobium sp.]
MKNILFIVVVFALFSCNESENGEQSEEIDMNGPDFEINVLSFSIEDRKTEVEVINRTDKDFKSIRGRLNFIDEAEEPLMTVTGNPITSPFQSVANPKVVGAKSKTNLTLNNQIEEGTASIKISEITVESTDGEKLKF